MLALTLTVIDSGVVQHPPPVFAIVSQAPPLLVVGMASNVKLVPELSPVLATANTCGKGLAPPKGIVKLIGLICRKTLVPTVTLMGTVMLLPAVWNKT